VSCKPSENMMLGMECARGESPLDTLYVCGPSVPEGADARFCIPAELTVATSGIPVASAEVGQLWVSYHLRFKKPTEMGNLGTTTASVPLAGNTVLGNPGVAAGTGLTILAAETATGTLEINTLDTTGLALAVTANAAGHVTLPALSITGSTFAYVCNYQFSNTFAAPSADTSSAISNCSVLQDFYVAAVEGGITRATCVGVVDPTDVTLPSVFEPSLLCTLGTATNVSLNSLYIPTFANVAPEKSLSDLQKQLRLLMEQVEKFSGKEERRKLLLSDEAQGKEEVLPSAPPCGGAGEYMYIDVRGKPFVPGEIEVRPFRGGNPPKLGH